MVTIGFTCDNYMVTEGVDNSANLTVELIFGQLGRQILVAFDTSYPSGTATSMSCMLLFHCDVSVHVKVKGYQLCYYGNM